MERGPLFLEKLPKEWDNILITILICNNVVNIGAASLSTVLVAQFLGDIGGLGQAAAITTGVMTLIILIFGEIVPKTLAKQHAEEMSMVVFRYIHHLSRILLPVIRLFKFVSIIVVRMLGGKIEDKKYILTEKEIVAIVDAGEREGVLEEEERNMIHGVIEFGDTLVYKVMVPRVDMACFHFFEGRFKSSVAKDIFTDTCYWR